MSEIIYSSAVTGRDREILQLLGNCFPEYWQKHAEKGVFPHEEVAFVADCGGRPVGHVGAMPFEVFLADGRTVKLAGIASVATDPEFRGKGIAATLCRMALEWGRANGIIAMPLYTSLFVVYEKSGWKVCENAAPIIRIHSALSPKRATDLTAAEKAAIIHFYENSPAFPGKVKRVAHSRFHSWERMFRNPDYLFYLGDSGYALEIDGVLAEQCGAEFTTEAADADPYHGEKPMWAWTSEPDYEITALIRDGRFNFPLADKF